MYIAHPRIWMDVWHGNRRDPFSLCSDTYKIFCHRRRAAAYRKYIRATDCRLNAILHGEVFTRTYLRLWAICILYTTRARKQTMRCQHIVDVFQFNFDGMCGGGGGGAIRKQKFNLKHTLIKLIYVCVYRRRKGTIRNTPACISNVFFFLLMLTWISWPKKCARTNQPNLSYIQTHINISCYETPRKDLHSLTLELLGGVHYNAKRKLYTKKVSTEYMYKCVCVCYNLLHFPASPHRANLK